MYPQCQELSIVKDVAITRSENGRRRRNMLQYHSTIRLTHLTRATGAGCEVTLRVRPSLQDRAPVGPPVLVMLQVWLVAFCVRKKTTFWSRVGFLPEKPCPTFCDRTISVMPAATNHSRCMSTQPSTLQNLLAMPAFASKLESV